MSKLHDLEGTMGLTVNVEFLNKATTLQAIHSELISPNQFLKITEVRYDDEKAEFHFECELYTYLLH